MLSPVYLFWKTTFGAVYLRIWEVNENRGVYIPKQPHETKDHSCTSSQIMIQRLENFKTPYTLGGLVSFEIAE